MFLAEKSFWGIGHGECHHHEPKQAYPNLQSYPVSVSNFLTRSVAQSMRLFLVLFLGVTFATADEPRDFSLPKGDAAETLKLFATQAQREILYSSKHVAGVTTNLVSGEYSPRAALDLMVAGTGLVVIEDRATGALMVNRPSTGGQSPASAVVAPKPYQRPAMNRKLPIAAIAAWFAVLTAPAPAQNAAEPTKSDAAKQEEETIILSPFVVDASKDQGYRATSTLAGSRINTPLKDIGASITVVTSEFLTDVSAAGINDILSYTANTEGFKEITPFTAGLGNPTDPGSEGSQTANRLRGLARADLTRDYFFTIGGGIGFDTYNLDQVTINRGPNSILAGLGSAAGIINYSPQLAHYGRNKGELSYRFGSFGDHRATFNSNIVLKENVLAIRVAAVASDVGFKQKPSYQRDNRIYGAVTFNPWKTTTIRASYEQVQVTANVPNALTPGDNVSQWVAVGKPLYDRTSTDPLPAGIISGQTTNGVFISASGAIENGYNFDQFRLYSQRNAAGVNLWIPPRMHDNRYGNWDSLNINPNVTNHDLDTFTFSVDQEIIKNLNASVSFLHEHQVNDDQSATRPDYYQLYVDINKFLPSPTGPVANPHLGETFFNFSGLDNRVQYRATNDVARAALTYQLDLKKYNKWFGRYNVTGFVERRETETGSKGYTDLRTDSGLQYLKSTATRFYAGSTESSKITRVPGPLGPKALVPNIYFDATSGTFKTDTLSSGYFLTTQRANLTKLDSEAAILQAYLWDDKIIATAGVRRDTNKAGSLTSNNGSQPTAATLLVTNYGKLSEFSQTTKTYGVVARPLKWLSFHYNRAQNFIPNAGSTDLLGNTTPAPNGLGIDYGFSLALLEDKLNLKVNWFELTAANAASASANFPLAQWVLPWMETMVMPEMAKAAGIQYQPLIAPGYAAGDSRLANAYTSDQVSEGLEIELTYNVTPNWRIMGSISKQEAKETNIAPGQTEFIENRLAYWKSTPGLWTGQRWANSPWGAASANWSGEEWWNANANSQYLTYKSNDGKPSQAIAKWHASALTTYEFTDGFLKGFSVGGGARYIDKAVIGNPVIKNAAGNVIGLDLDHPYTYNAYVSVDAWIGYETRLKFLGDRKVSFQLNGRDLQEGGSYRPVNANSDGTHSVFRIVQPRTFYLTTRVEF
jgi:outer membrane receptor protein involved in Fe transport